MGFCLKHALMPGTARSPQFKLILFYSKVEQPNIVIGSFRKRKPGKQQRSAHVVLAESTVYMSRYGTYDTMGMSTFVCSKAEGSWHDNQVHIPCRTPSSYRQQFLSYISTSQIGQSAKEVCRESLCSHVLYVHREFTRAACSLQQMLVNRTNVKQGNS